LTWAEELFQPHANHQHCELTEHHSNFHEHTSYKHYALTFYTFQFPNCLGDLKFDCAASKKWGLCWRERLACTDCDFVSEYHKLYDGERLAGSAFHRVVFH
jgi:hypothetical protein